MDINKNILRDRLLGIKVKIRLCDGREVCQINFDNAATTPPIKKCSIEYIRIMSNYYASIGRGTGQKAEFTTNLYNECKRIFIKFF